MAATEVAPDVRAPVGSFLTLRQHEFIDKIMSLGDFLGYRQPPEVKDDWIWMPLKPSDVVIVFEFLSNSPIPKDHPIQSTVFTFGCWVSLNLPYLT